MAKRSPNSLVFIALLFLGGAGLVLVIVAVIRQEAKETRQAMNDVAGSVVSDEIKETIDVVRTEGVETAEDVGKAGVSVLGEIRDILRDLPLPTPGSSKKEPAGSKEPNTTQSPSKKSPPTSTPPASVLDPNAIIHDIFKTGHELSRAIDRQLQEFVKLDPAEQVQIGAELHQCIVADQKVISDPALLNKIRTIAAAALKKAERSGQKFTFTVLDEPELNAFAHIGGYVYINRGLLQAIDDQAELEFVLGHEVGHVVLGHCAEQMSYQARAAQVSGQVAANLLQLGYNTIASGYSEDKELEADAWAHGLLGSRRAAAISLLKKLGSFEPDKDQPAKPNVITTTTKEIDDHFATHPTIAARIAALNKLR